MDAAESTSDAVVGKTCAGQETLVDGESGAAGNLTMTILPVFWVLRWWSEVLTGP